MADTSGRTGRDADATTPVRTVFLSSAERTPLHRHAEEAAWIHVLSGAIVEERWRADDEGGFVQEQRVLRAGQSMAAPVDGLHRVIALSEAAFVITSACDCLRARQAEPREVAVMQRLARSGPDLEWAATTAVGEPVPPIDAMRR
jgi:quercetin dioxygenase-like cupin family protein